MKLPSASSALPILVESALELLQDGDINSEISQACIKAITGREAILPVVQRSMLKPKEGN